MTLRPHDTPHPTPRTDRSAHQLCLHRTLPHALCYRFFSDPLQGPRKVAKAVTGSTGHTLVLLRNGEVYAWGEGEGGQLGHGGPDDAYSPKRIEGLVGKDIVAIASGNAHSLCMAWSDELEPDGSRRPIVYAFGEASFGQLGHGGTEDLYNPQEGEVMAFRDRDVFWKFPKPPPAAVLHGFH